MCYPFMSFCYFGCLSLAHLCYCFQEDGPELGKETVSLGDEDSPAEIKCTPAKRKLESLFDCAELGCSSSGCPGDKAVVADGNSTPSYVFVTVKTEKE